MTLRELLRSSFRLIGVLHEGQGPNGDDIADGLVVLNSMLSSWSIDRLNIFTFARDEYPLNGTQQTYLLGAGAPDFDGARPIRIDSAAVIYAGSGVPSETPLEILTVTQWEEISCKQATSTLPARLYADNGFPYCGLNLWPIPTMAAKLVLYTWRALVGGFLAAALDVAVSFPPGYEDAIRYGLAVRLAPEWDKKIRPDVLALAHESKIYIQSINAPAPVLSCDPSILSVGSRRGGWNYLTGS